MTVFTVKCPKCNSTNCHPLFYKDLAECINCEHVFDMYGRWYWRLALWLRPVVLAPAKASDPSSPSCLQPASEENEK